MPRKKKETLLTSEQGLDKKKAAAITAAPHIWKPGHDPNDPDAEPGSGWEYVTLKPLQGGDSEDKLDKYKKGGGPESGLPCMTCRTMTRIVDEVPALDILDKTFTIPPERRDELKDERVAIIMCPQCESITHMRADAARSLSTRYSIRKKE
jgi:hypothetical protein